MTNTEIVPGTPELLQRFYGKLPSQSTRALVLKEGEKLLVVAGLYTKECGQVLFGDFSPEMDRTKYKREFVLCMRRLLSMAKQNGLPVYSKAKPTVDGSDRLLIHFGFKPVTDEVYLWRK